MWLINQCNIFVCFSPSTISFWLIATYSHVQFILWKKYGSYQHSEFTQLRLIRIQPWTPGVMNDWTVTTRKQTCQEAIIDLLWRISIISRVIMIWPGEMSIFQAAQWVLLTAVREWKKSSAINYCRIYPCCCCCSNLIVNVFMQLHCKRDPIQLIPFFLCRL